MRLLIAEHNCSHGTETVSLGIVPEFMNMVECIVWAMPPHRIGFYQRLIPPSERLIYEEILWPHESRWFWRAFGLLQRMELLLPRSRIVTRLRTRLTDSRLRHLIRQYRLTHFFTTWIFNVEMPKLPVPMGAMAMDLNWQKFPENFPENTRESLDRPFAKWLAEADVVFPISDFTAQEMKKAFPRPTKRVKVVPHGARVLRPGPADAPPPPRNQAPSRAFFYYPASLFAHKDHQTAIEAAIALYAKGCDFDLVFSGWGTEHLLNKMEDSNDLSEALRARLAQHAALINQRIKCLGIVDRAKVEDLVLNARALVLPSRFEGFGLPLLEAIERGAPVICTDIPPFLEQIRRYDYADDTSIFPAGDVNRLVELMEAALNKPARPRPSPDEISARTQRWTWKDAAAAYAQALREA